MYLEEIADMSWTKPWRREQTIAGLNTMRRELTRAGLNPGGKSRHGLD
jgi:hypothetical protein